MITAAGWPSSKRKSRDGVIYFGSLSDKSEDNKLIDYDMNITMTSKDQNKEKKIIKESSIVFMIYFNLDECKYFIRAYTPAKNNKKESELPYIIVQITNPYVRIKFILRK